MIKNLNENMTNIHLGAFLTSGNNVMTIGWGMAGVVWRKNVFIAPVRLSRLTKEFIENTKEFAVSFPKPNTLTEELRLCGTVSGRQTDKLSLLKTHKATKIDTFLIDDCETYYECKVLASIPVTKDCLGDFAESFYKDSDDIHVFFIGEILN